MHIIQEVLRLNLELFLSNPERYYLLFISWSRQNLG